MQPEHASIILRFLLGTLEREHPTTAKVIAAIPAGRSDYSPDPKSKNAFDLAWHIAASEIYFMTGATEGKFPSGGDDGGRPASIKTPADIVVWYRERFAASVAKLKTMSGEDLVRPVNFHDKFVFPALAYIQLMITHSSHHRGQLSAYLRPMGAKVPSIYGPSGDEEIMEAGA